ncbi:MAG TPA: TlpA disulfide reductase family protein [Longimicrobiales bacterium]
MTRRWIAIAACALLGACADAPAPRGAIGSPAPEYAAPTLDGDSISLASLHGEAVLLNVWATWCPPCRKEMPDLQALHEEFRDDGLRVVGISIDAAGADDLVRDFIDDYGITYPIVRDPGERITSLFPAQGVPITVLIDAGGTVAWRHLGPVTADDPGLRAAIADALPAIGE